MAIEEFWIWILGITSLLACGFGLICLFLIRNRRSLRRSAIANLQQRQLLVYRLKQQNIELKQVNNYLSKGIEAREKIFALITHDIKSPLDSLRVWAASLTENGAAKHVSQALQEFIRELNRVNISLEQALEWASSKQENITGLTQKLDLNLLLDEIHDSFLPACAQKGIQFRLTYYPEESHIQSDADIIRFILNNLITNAIKFTPQHKSIRLGLTREANDWHIIVEDEGTGIPPHYLKQLMTTSTPSMRTTGLRGEEGTGLGLKMSQELAIAINAKLDALSILGQGSRFRLIIPVAI